MIARAIIMLNDHRFWGHVSCPSSSSGKTLSSFHPLLARPCRSALPRERFSPLALIGRHSRTQECLLLGEERKSRLRHPTSESDPEPTSVLQSTNWPVTNLGRTRLTGPG